MARNVDKSASRAGRSPKKEARRNPKSVSSKTTPKLGRKVSSVANKESKTKPRLVRGYSGVAPALHELGDLTDRNNRNNHNDRNDRNDVNHVVTPPQLAPSPPLATNLRLIERRRHPRFLLSGEQFRDVKNRKIFSVYDLSQTGLSLKTDDTRWDEGTVISGVLNLHPESIEIMARVLGYYGDRAALRFEGMSTYGRGVLSKCLSPARLGKSLALVRENLKISDLWFHGACSTDVFVRLDEQGGLKSVEVFFSNYFCGWYTGKPKLAHSAVVEKSQNGHLITGLIQSAGPDRLIAAGAELGPVSLELLNVAMDPKVDDSKVSFAHSLIMASTMDVKIKENILRRLLLSVR